MQLKILDKRGLSGILESIINGLLIIAAVLLIAGIPLLRAYLDKYLPAYLPAHRLALAILLEYFDLIAIAVLWQGRGLLRNINHGQPFIADNVRRIRRVAACSLLLAAGFGVASFYLLSFFPALLAAAFLLLAPLLWVCAQLFDQAVRYKAENELTI